jgi:hypothetical protein
MKVSEAMFRFGTTAVLLAAVAAPARATSFKGTVYYTVYTDGDNVNKVSYSYDDTTKKLTLGTGVNIARTPGADGIIFAPNGNLLIGGQSSGADYMVDPTTGAYTSASTDRLESYHMSLAPDGKSVYTSPFEGRLINIPLSNFGTSNPASVFAISGDDRGITTLTFVPGNTTTAFYVNGNPNNFGDFGYIDLKTLTTHRLMTGLLGAHGMVYDPFTKDLILGGGGYIDQIDPNNPTKLVSQTKQLVGDIDQLAVDGKGHLFAAGADSITFLDYSTTGKVGDASNFHKSIGGFTNIDDVAPLVGLGAAPTPEPSTLVLAAIGGLCGLGARRRRRTARPS